MNRIFFCFALFLCYLSADIVKEPYKQSPSHTPSLILYYSPHCPYSQKVLRYLKEIHRSVPLRNVEGNKQAKRELRELGGQMIVPCLVIDGQPLYDPDAIIEWLSTHQDLLEAT